MDKETLARFEKIEKRLAILEDGHGVYEGEPEKSVIEMDLTLPEAVIDGLHFNETKVHAVFDKKEDGWYYSRDILFLSARNTKDDNSRDILTEYLESEFFRLAIADVLFDYHKDIIDTEFETALQLKDCIKVSMPTENEGIKQYNGVDWGYWQKQPYSGSAAYFCLVTGYGHTHTGSASAVGGCAPAFCVRE